MMRHSLLVARTGALLALAMGACATASAALQVDITKSSQQAIPIAIVPFASPGSGVSANVSKVVRNDLASTGLFNVTPPDQLPARPQSVGGVNYKTWQTASIDNLVVGRLDKAPKDQYQLKFHLLDTAQSSPSAGWQIKTGGKNLRGAAHVAANLIYKEFIGKPGYFQSQIAYVSVTGRNKSRRYKLVVSDYDGFNPSAVFSSKNPIMSPAWSPAGTRLAYVAFNVDKGRTSLRIQNLATGNIKKVSSRPGINGAPAWSPDGSKLAITLSYKGNPDIYIYDVNSGRLRQLTHDPAIDTEATWSPDGQHIAFTSSRGGNPQVYRINSSGGSAERLTYDGKSNQSPAYAPTGDRLAMVRQTSGNGYRIAVRNLDTGRSRIVSKGPLDDGPNFAPNGQAIIYAKQTGHQALETVSINGNGRTRLSQKGQVRDPAWGPSGS